MFSYSFARLFGFRPSVVHITLYKVTGVHSHKKVGKEKYSSFLKKTDNFIVKPDAGGSTIYLASYLLLSS